MESYDLRAVATAYPSSFPSPPTKLSDIDTLSAGANSQVQTSDLRQVAQRLKHHESAMLSPSSQLSFDHQNPSDMPSLLSDHPLVGLGSDLTVIADVEEDSGIHLVHMLITCADSIQRGDLPLAAALLEYMNLLLKHLNTSYGIGKVAAHFIDALRRRLLPLPAADLPNPDDEILHHHFYEASPYLKFAHFTANQAILEAFDGHDHVHIIDFDLIHGLQWPPLIQALALRPNGPPTLTLTGIGPPDRAHEVGSRLARLARSVNIRFTFRRVTVSRLEDVKLWMLHVDPKEVVAVNSIMRLHRVLGSNDNSIDSVLRWVRDLDPKILTMVEQEADHNRNNYLDRFTEALCYYSTMFDSLEACLLQPEKALAEKYIQREICNVLCCEGPARVERHEPLAKWWARLGWAGFEQSRLGANAFKQANMLLTLFSAEGYSVEENEGCLTLGWHGRPLIAASAWKTGPRTDQASSNGVTELPGSGFTPSTGLK